MVEEPSVTLDFTLVDADGSGEDLDQIVVDLLLILVNALLPSHMGGGLHILRG